jgi:hypothetical protein
MQSVIIHRALADTANVFFPDLSSADPVSYIVASFNYVAGFIAALVVLVALWGVIKLMSHPGSSSDKSESRGIFWNVLIGVLFFALIYFFFTNVLSPDLGNLRMPSLQQLNTPSSTAVCGGVNSGTCSDPATRCVNQETTAGIRNYQCITATSGVCGGPYSGTCSDSTQRCINQGSAGSPNYQCVANSSFDCGTPPNHPGNCANNGSCVRRDNPDAPHPPATIVYGCQ